MLEFTSAPTETDDSRVLLHVWNESKTRKLTLTFNRNGWYVAGESDVMSGAAAVPVTAGQADSRIEPAAAAAVQEPTVTDQQAAQVGSDNTDIVPVASF